MRSLHVVAVAVLFFVAVGLALPHFFELGPNADGLDVNVTLALTRDYGRVLLKDADFNPSLGLTAMEMLRNITDIETRYGGLYVHSAQGLESDISKRLDWFYYVNGVYMDRGLASYRPKPGEVVQVDYHYWGSYSGSPGFLSGYPARLMFGFDGKKGNLSIVGPGHYSKELAKLGRRLSSLFNCSYEIIEPEAAQVGALASNSIVIADVHAPEFYDEVLDTRKRAFWPVTFREGGVWLHEPSGKVETELVDGFAIQAVDLPGGRWVLMVLATDHDWARSAIGLLQEGQSLGYHVAIAVDSTGAIPLPVVG